MPRTHAAAALVFALLAGAACSKTETANANPDPGPKTGGPERIAVPTNGMPRGGHIGGVGDPLDPTKDTAPGGGAASATTLSAEEGALTAESPADCKAGVASTAKVRLVPAKGYDVNLKYPFKLTFTAPDGVTLDKPALHGGGHDGNGDAETLDLHQMVVPVKLVAAKPGDYAIGGQFEFAICKEDACITKHVPVSLQIAAK